MAREGRPEGLGGFRLALVYQAPLRLRPPAFLTVRGRAYFPTGL
jgi:hypothetical protein